MIRKNFTIIELLVVISIILILAGLLLPALMRSKSMAMEKACMSNMRQIHLALAVYCENNKNYYPLTPTHGNSLLVLTEALDANTNGLRNAFYCPQAYAMEQYAQDTVRYPAVGDSTSIENTDANWAAGNVSCYYWSYKMPKMFGAAMWFATSKTSFWPRELKGDGIQKSCCYSYPAANFDYDANGNLILPYASASPSERWVLTDFFRQGAPFPHMYKHAQSLTVVFLDGHADLTQGRPRDNYR